MLHPRAFPEAAQQAFSAEPGDIDVKAVKRNRASDEALRLNKYEVELARGASHIASTLYEESMLAAVRETILQFEAPHGRDDLMTFAHALLRRLELREKPAAAKVLHDFIECGRLPEEIPSTPPRPVSARKPVARKVDGTDSRKSEARVTAKGA
ncbi:hypothetical protein OKW43_005717 [Paraburkholderia sp. WC7.3g]|uniref:Uncharacterized protein n=1 Tax=Paraburkholderia podalyriae TaxID=1938811 RepID=A0ABR7Q1H9_9BURK|nr:hypothetical protein [Paraburkholderia podalyriae]MBC8752379.1 hypothetical protein [Paraburkholderia podalyriae]